MDEAHAKRTKSLHKEMKKQHHFLTGKDDIPYAVLLTREPANAQLQAQTMRCYYDELVAQDFKRGDALQAMSQLLTLYNADFEPIVIDYVRAICTYLKRENIKIRRKFYPFIAMLALAQANEETLKEVIMMNKKLTVLNMFSLEPALAFMTAVQFVLQRMIEKEELQQFSDSMLFLQALNMNDFYRMPNLHWHLIFLIFLFKRSENNAKTKLWINGVWEQTNETTELTAPYTGEILAQVAKATVQDVERAIEGAHEAFQTFKKQQPMNVQKCYTKW